METTKVSVDGWVDKDAEVYFYVIDYCSIIKMRKSYHSQQHGWTWRHVLHEIVLIAQSCLTLCDPMSCSPLDSSVEFSRQEYWSGLPFLPSGGLPNTGTEPRSPGLKADSSLSVPPYVSQKNTVRVYLFVWSKITLSNSERSELWYERQRVAAEGTGGRWSKDNRLPVIRLTNNVLGI